MSKVDPHSDPRAYPIAWELRDDILSSIERVKQQVQAIDDLGDL
jgi:hypothetical protein